MESSLNLVRRLATLDDFDQRTELVFEHPELLNPQTQAALQKELKTLPPQECEALQPILFSLTSIRLRIESGEASYIIGMGPIERIWSQLETGEISESQATVLAKRVGSENGLSPLYCAHLSGHLIDLAHEGEWQTALRYAHLLAVAVRSLPSGEVELIAYANPILDWIEIAKESLVHLGDRRVYRQAQADGEALVRQADKHKEDLLRGAVLHRLGVLSLDPYRSGRSSLNYAVEIKVWQHRLADYYSSVLEEIPESEWLMPEPLEALRQAETYLRQAMDLRQGHDKGLTLKALVNDLEWRQRVLEDETVSRDEIVQLAVQALDALVADEDPAAMLDMMKTLDNYNTPIPPHHLQWFEDLFSIKSPDDYAEQFGDRRAVDMLFQAAQFLKHDNPAKAIQLVQAAQALIRRFGQEELAISAWNLELALVMKAYAGDFEGFEPAESLQDTLAKLQGRSEEKGWSTAAIGAHLLHLVMHAADNSQEASGLRILDSIAHLAPDIFHDHSEAMLNVRSRLLINVGAEAYNQKNYRDSVAAYVQAIQSLLQLGLVNRPLVILTRLADVVADCDPQAAINLIYGLQPVALELERTIGSAAVRLLQQMYRRINSQLFVFEQGEVSAIALNDLWQLAKGLRFATLLGREEQLDISGDKRCESLLKGIAEVEPGSMLEAESTNLDYIQILLEDLSLTAYDQEREQAAGEDHGQRLRNLQNSFDTYLNERLLFQNGDEASYLTPAQVMDALDERTVLISYYIGQTADLNYVTINLLAFTQQSITAVTIPTGIENKSAGVGAEQQLLLPPLGFEISDVRYAITQLPAFPGQPVSKEAAEQLEFCQHLFFGSFLSELGKYKEQGKDHLCVIPHGPLHYFPFHLLGPIGEPLAENWIVTYLPHIKLLTTPAAPPNVLPRMPSAIAMGISFQQFNPFQQDLLPQSISETESIAQIFKTPPLLERDVTRSRWMAALQSVPFVHLSTHGAHNRYAPAFQCLYLAPEDASDGRFFAYELIGLDLKGLKILTLSACETVLGRFDPSDNLRGIPAYLLTGGVKTIIGTLWSARPEAAERFFTTFYSELSGGKSTLDAFALAQRATREQFPLYDDWGPFYYIGDWQQ